MNIKSLAANSILVVLSTLLGYLIVNQALLFLSVNNNQKHGFPRKSLQYLDPVARWSYPDYDNSEEKQNVTYIVGDSHAEGAGDSFLNNEYKYSIGHFLDNKWRQNTNIYLAANGGSNIPAQLTLLEDHLSGKLNSLTGPPAISKNINVLLYFYEGNDLENTASSKSVPFQSQKDKSRLNFPIEYAIRTAKRNFNKKFKRTSNSDILPSSPSSPSSHNKICIGTTCRNMPPLQSASAGLSEKQIFNEVSYLESSVKNFSSKYPEASICLVYIPSPSTIYSPKGEFFYQKYSVHSSTATSKTDSKSNNSKSLLIRRLLRDRLNFNAMTFVDPTNALKKVSVKEFLHGENDPKHFNANGYRLLAGVTAQGCFMN